MRFKEICRRFNDSYDSCFCLLPFFLLESDGVSVGLRLIRNLGMSQSCQARDHAHHLDLWQLPVKELKAAYFQTGEQAQLLWLWLCVFDL